MSRDFQGRTSGAVANFFKNRADLAGFQQSFRLRIRLRIAFDEIEPASSPRRSARCRSRAISKNGERYPRETKSRHAVKRDG